MPFSDAQKRRIEKAHEYLTALLKLNIKKQEHLADKKTFHAAIFCLKIIGEALRNDQFGGTELGKDVYKQLNLLRNELVKNFFKEYVTTSKDRHYNEFIKHLVESLKSKNSAFSILLTILNNLLKREKILDPDDSKLKKFTSLKSSISQASKITFGTNEHLNFIQKISQQFANLKSDIDINNERDYFAACNYFDILIKSMKIFKEDNGFIIKLLNKLVNSSDDENESTELSNILNNMSTTRNHMIHRFIDVKENINAFLQNIETINEQIQSFRLDDFNEETLEEYQDPYHSEYQEAYDQGHQDTYAIQQGHYYQNYPQQYPPYLSPTQGYYPYQPQISYGYTPQQYPPYLSPTQSYYPYQPQIPYGYAPRQYHSQQQSLPQQAPANIAPHSVTFQRPRQQRIVTNQPEQEPINKNDNNSPEKSL
jgi:uncharacterized protein with HEPN domain